MLKKISYIFWCYMPLMAHAMTTSFEETFFQHALDALEVLNAKKFELCLKALPTFEQQQRLFLVAYFYRFDLQTGNKELDIVCNGLTQSLAQLSVCIVNENKQALALFLTAEQQTDLLARMPSTYSLALWHQAFSNQTSDNDKYLYNKAVLALLQNNQEKFNEYQKEISNTSPLKDYLAKLNPPPEPATPTSARLRTSKK